MTRTTNFIIIKDSDLGDGMPTHFTGKYGVLNPETKRMNKRTWEDLIIDKEYQLGHGSSPKLIIDGVECTLIGLRLDFLDGDYEAACEYGVGKNAPFGEVLSWQKAEKILNKYQIKNE